jgi:Tfp pilus assembly protein PilO
MELLNVFLEAVPSIPTFYTVVFAAFALIVTGYLQYKKVDILEKTGASTAHKELMEVLLAQIEMLSQQLDHTREQLNELHDRNIMLMGQLREANFKIADLEHTLRGLGHTIDKITPSS